MTNELAIRILIGEVLGTTSQTNEAIEMAVKALSLLSAQSEPQWIPCNERLPEESDGTVLVCFPNEFPYSNKEPFINAKHNQRVKTASYSQFNKTWYIGNFGAISEVKPIAWMSLPAPYEAEKRENENDRR